ncbi:MAG: osmoprotectant transport system permease protein [Thermoleophilaceae bacterium]|nr:osmoprotectant transport system permease protein [Thermoleophilaceae bacterium]
MIHVLATKAVVAQTVIPDFGGGGANSCVRQDKLFCWDWFSAHWGNTFQPALIDHVKLTLIAVGIGFVISFALALVAYRYVRLETPITLLTGLLFTIPSAALFQLLVPITGLTTTTVEVALVSYTLLILFRNIVVGLRGVSEEVREAARGMGLTRAQTLFRVELPLAVPEILAGIQVATVTVISLATVGAFIVDEGLGGPIFKALQTSFNTEFIAAGALTTLLAVIAYLLIAGAQRVLTPWAGRSVAR